MQKEIEKVLRKYKVIATADDYTVAKDIVEVVLDCIGKGHEIKCKTPENLLN